MDYKFCIYDDRKDWDECLSYVPEDLRDIFFMGEYYEIDHNKSDIRCFLARNKDNVFYYVYSIRKINNLGYDLNCDYFDIQGAYGYNGPITKNKDDDFSGMARKIFEDYCHDSNILAEFIRFNPLYENHELCGDMGIVKANTNVIVDLNMEDIYRNSYEHSTRKNIKKAERSNLVAKIISPAEISEKQLQDFHFIYSHTMTRNSADGKYLHPLDYFKRVKRLIPNNSFFIFVCKDQIPVSAELVLFNDYAGYSFLGGTLPEYFMYRPNDFLKHNVINRLKERGLSYFCLGGGNKINDGIFKYKRSFAKNDSNIHDFFIGKRIYNETLFSSIIEQWKMMFPANVKKYENYFLRYECQE
jgi:hypothetical protein